MTCFTRCGIGCCPNSPRPIFVFGDCSTSTDIINPIIPTSYGFFENNLGGAVATGGIIPVTATSLRGSKITASTTTSGAVNLTPGTYEITYFVNGTIPASATMSVGLESNGTQIAGSTATISGTAGNQATVQKTIVLTVTENTTLGLYNLGTDSLTISNANLVVKEL